MGTCARYNKHAMTFLEKLTRAQKMNRSYLCVGLDIVVANTPLPLQEHDEPMLPFARAIIDATQDLVCAYKPNLGFYLAEGAAGMVALERIVRERLREERRAYLIELEERSDGIWAVGATVR